MWYFSTSTVAILAIRVRTRQKRLSLRPLNGTRTRQHDVLENPLLRPGYCSYPALTSKSNFVLTTTVVHLIWLLETIWYYLGAQVGDIFIVVTAIVLTFTNVTVWIETESYPFLHKHSE